MAERRVSIIQTIWYVLRNGLGGGGGIAYKGALVGLALMAFYGLYLWAFIQQAPVLLGSSAGGMITTAMSDSVPWGLYISFFIFWVGIAAAGIVFGIAAYVFSHPGFERIAVLAEAQAIAALVIALLLVFVDVGRPLRTMILIPQLPNFPSSMLDWDFLVLTTYLVLNIIAYLYTVKRGLEGLKPSKTFERIFIVIAAPFAIGIHTVTAFISQALIARPYWNSPLLAPRYVATAFASGPALLLLLLLAAEHYLGFKVDEDVYRKTVYVIAGSLVVGLYFTLSEAQEILWYVTEPLKLQQASTIYYGYYTWWLGLMFWLWVILGSLAVLLTLSPRVRSTRIGLLAIALLTLVGVVCEKTLTIVVPAFTPNPLGQIVPYTPTPLEIMVTLGVHALGLIVYLALALPAIKLMEVNVHHESS